MNAVRLRAGTITLLLAALCLTLAATKVFAQGAGNSTITGTVVESGGVVPGAVVTLTEAATKVVSTTPTNEVGVFRFAGIRPGQYTLKVELQGFRPLKIGRASCRERVESAVG